MTGQIVAPEILQKWSSLTPLSSNPVPGMDPTPQLGPFILPCVVLNQTPLQPLLFSGTVAVLGPTKIYDVPAGFRYVMVYMAVVDGVGGVGVTVYDGGTQVFTTGAAGTRIQSPGIYVTFTQSISLQLSANTATIYDMQGYLERISD